MTMKVIRCEKAIWIELNNSRFGKVLVWWSDFRGKRYRYRNGIMGEINKFRP